MIISSTLRLKDSFTVTMKKAKKETEGFKGEVEKAKQMEAIKKAKVAARLRVAEDRMTPTLNKINAKLAPLRKGIVTTIAIKDNATAKINGVIGKMRRLAAMVARPIVGTRGAASIAGTGGGGGESGGLLGGLAAVGLRAGPLAALAGGAAVGSAAMSGISSAAQQEQQMITLRALTGNKSGAMAKWARQEGLRTGKTNSEMLGVTTGLAPFAKDTGTMQNVS